MDRLFLDANVLFSAANRPNVVLCTSCYALEEARINLTEDAQLRRLKKLSDNLNLFDPTSRELPRGVSLPEKHIPILVAAGEARCAHLTTGDLRHFGPYFRKKLAGLLVLL